MGTRAIISINGFATIATHRDGFPLGMGQELLLCKTMEEVLKVAEKHTIDCVAKLWLEEQKKKRTKHLAAKHKLTQAEIRQGKRRGCVMSAEDWLPDDISSYGDFAEWEYNFEKDHWRVRALRGEWPKSRETAGGFDPLEWVIKKQKEEQKEGSQE